MTFPSLSKGIPERVLHEILIVLMVGFSLIGVLEIAKRDE
jgi:hypothetical protein